MERELQAGGTAHREAQRQECAGHLKRPQMISGPVIWDGGGAVIPDEPRQGNAFPTLELSFLICLVSDQKEAGDQRWEGTSYWLGRSQLAHWSLLPLSQCVGGSDPAAWTKRMEIQFCSHPSAWGLSAENSYKN